MSEQKIFKTSAFGGFKKADVLSYIDNISTQTQKEKAELDEKVKKLEGELLSAKNEVPQAVSTGMSDEEKAQLGEEKQRSQEMSSLIDRLNLEMAKQKKVLDEKDAEIVSLQGEVDRLQQKLVVNGEKAAKYDEIAVKVGSLVIDAKREADKIVENAKQEAQNITKAKEERLSKMNEEFLQFKSGVENIRKELRGTLEILDDKLGKISQMAVETGLDISDTQKEEPAAPAGEVAERPYTIFAPFQFD